MADATIEQALQAALYGHKAGKFVEAEKIYRMVLARQPDNPDALHLLGMIAAHYNQFDGAIDLIRRAIAIRPDITEYYGNLGRVLSDCGLIEEAISVSRHGLQLNPNSIATRSNLILALNYYERYDPAVVLSESIHWARLHADSLKRLIPTHTNDSSPDRKLKIGYVSFDFRDHPVGRYFLPLMQAHDPAQVEAFCYSDVLRPDAATDRTRSEAHQWRDSSNLTDAQLAKQIQEDQIDILVDLAGHTSNNRLLVFARKPAPVQVAWLGYPSTTGLATIDYRLTDARADPPGASDAFSSEQLFRLPHTAWCFQPVDQSSMPDPSEADETMPITFCSFNNFSKVTEPMLQLWAKILLSVPTSRLLIKARPLGCRFVQERVRQIISAAGVSSDRLELRGWHTSFEEHLASYGQTHVALDTFPYHGTTTTCDALWMGVPVVTLAGKTQVSRVGVSLLSTIGMPELVAESPEQYIRIAADLANDIPRLNRIRRSLRQTMQNSPLMDARQFARDMESAYRKMWKTWCSKPR